MNKYKKIAYAFLIIIIIASGFIIYKVSGKDGDINIKEKADAEIQYIDGKLVNLFNELNNIKFDGYTISATNISENDTSTQSSEQNSSSSSSSGSSSEGDSKGKSAGNSGSGGSSENEGSSEKQNNKQYTLEGTGVLNKKEEINWEEIKKEVENVYSSLSSMTLDLYKTDAKYQEILDFNKEYDNLIKAVKEENKEDTLAELAKLYDYIPKFKEACSNESSQIIIANTKNYLFKAYSILDKEDWATIASNINHSTQEFTKLVTNVENKNNKQYNINKSYIMINEMQNAVTLQDKEVFLIKYKNLLEELENI